MPISIVFGFVKPRNRLLSSLECGLHPSQTGAKYEARFAFAGLKADRGVYLSSTAQPFCYAVHSGQGLMAALKTSTDRRWFKVRRTLSAHAKVCIVEILRRGRRDARRRQWPSGYSHGLNCGHSADIAAIR